MWKDRGRTDATKLIVAFRNFVNTHKNDVAIMWCGWNKHPLFCKDYVLLSACEVAAKKNLPRRKFAGDKFY